MSKRQANIGPILTYVCDSRAAVPIKCDPYLQPVIGPDSDIDQSNA